MSERKIFKPQAGKQEMFLGHSADICIYGGAAGGGKTYALLLEPLYHMRNPQFEAVIFRQQRTQILNAGGLWDVSSTIYPFFGAQSVQSPKLMWTFPSGMRITFSFLGSYKDVTSWQGSQVPLLCVEMNTPVLMGDGTYKRIAEIRPGDMVQTLHGAREVTAVGVPTLKECVRVELPDGSAQIQSVDHKILTESGWISYQDPGGGDSRDGQARLVNGAAIYRSLDRSAGNSPVLWYSHPYTGQEQTADCVQLEAVKMTPVGLRWTVDMTVDSENQYITEAGLINKNCFDELTHYSEKTFFYMLSRNRSTCGVKPYIRATCNPDADSWVAKFIEWWIDPETGYPIPERCGKIRWFLRREETLYWADTRQELWDRFNLKTESERAEPKSVSFISSVLQDNKILMEQDPGYMANLKALPLVEKERLLKGNWKIRPAAGLYFPRKDVSYVEVVPSDVSQWVRCWDLAATETEENEDAAYTAGVLIGKRRNGRYIIADVINRQMSAAEVRQTIYQTAVQDRSRYRRVRIRLPQDPGQAGKEQAQSYTRFLSGFDVTTVLESGSKITRAEPLAAQWQGGNVDILVAPWNEAYVSQMENFPAAALKDMADASANGFAEVESRSTFNLRNLI